MPQSGADLVSAGYPTTFPLWSLLGGTTSSSSATAAAGSQIAAPNYPARTNLHFPFGGMAATAVPSSGGIYGAVVPVVPGDTITKMSVLVGGTAATSPTHSWMALYSGLATPALIVQSADATTTAIPASAAYTATLSTPTTITAVNAPFGFVYAAICITGTGMPNVATVSTPTAVGYQWFSNGPLAFGFTATGSASTAPNGLASLTANANAPVFFLT
jgi:hypothetical protein